MARQYDVITVGNVRMDAYMSIHDPKTELHSDSDHHGEACFRLGSKIRVDRYDFLMGGNAANVAVGVNRLGLKTTIVAETGDDEFSIKIRNCLAKENIERLFIVQTKGGASNLSVIINFAGDRTIFAEEREQEHNFSLDEAEAKWVYLTSLGRSWGEPYKMVLEFVEAQNAKLAFNPGSLQLKEGKDVVHQVLKKTEILFVNKEEAELILFNHYNKKIDNTEHYIKNLCLELQHLGPKIVVLTNGKEGSYVLSLSGEFMKRDLIEGKVVERTGAGDAYAAGFLAAHVHGLDLGTCMTWGGTNAASVVGQVGAEAGLLTREKMMEKLEK
ncbi:MAG TPA: carbohydrate kinase family protein [Xanthomonadales bacterium]|nr:carbohydrate kinase family protein [Xanthomonadales bacterium]